MPPLLELTGCAIRFGGLTAVDRLSLAIQPGELLGLIGPNGAGKSTVFNLITGLYRPTEGDIRLDGRSLVGLRPDQVAHLGVARTFQNIRLFRDLTVMDNVRVAAGHGQPYLFLDAVARTGRFYREDGEITARSWELLRRLGLESAADRLPSKLPYGDQRRVEIARALALSPRLLLLDEPTAGMNPRETGELMRLVQDLKEEFGLTILLIEHDMRVVMGICQRVVVLDYGVALAEGTPEQIRGNPAVIEAYLGESK